MISALFVTCVIGFILFILIYYRYSKNVFESKMLWELFRDFKNKRSAKLYYITFFFRRG